MKDELAELGFRVIAISPDRPELLTQSLEVKDLGYELYSDSDLEAARAMGIAFQVGRVMGFFHRLMGAGLEEASGRDHRRLPVPSVFLVEAGGEILWVYSNPDFTVRPDNDSVLEAARRARDEP